MALDVQQRETKHRYWRRTTKVAVESSLSSTKASR